GSSSNCGYSHHGTQTVTAAIAQNNLMAVQFHPEKSSSQGLQLLGNFVNLVNQSSLESKKLKVESRK
ncbi:MAG: hypothetical protein HC916_20550, partial [Coleofasciculaceae cyanobacterium SM2_1_6]|nr:hypothetical protein [Coleofasciculaceae cyanobacterium SM2_1_6]